MFLHIGGDFSVRLGEVISIHDYEFMKRSESGQAFLQKKKKALRDISDGRPKAVVITEGKIYLSALSPGTLKKRAGEIPQRYNQKINEI